MKQLFSLLAICLSIYSLGQNESEVIRSMRRLDSITTSAVKRIDNGPAPATLYDTLTRCENGCDNKIQFYYTYTYDLNGSLLKVKVFDKNNEKIIQYYYLNDKMVHINIADGKGSSRSWRSMNFHNDYSPLTTYKYDESTVEHIQFLVDGYKLLIRFKDLMERRS